MVRVEVDYFKKENKRLKTKLQNSETPLCDGNG